METVLYFDSSINGSVADFFISKYKPYRVYRQLVPGHAFWLQTADPGILITRLRHRKYWTFLPPHITLEVWNARPTAPMPLGVWALTMVQVPLPSAKAIVKKGQFVRPSTSKKWADKVEEAHDFLNRCETLAPPPMTVLRTPTPKTYRSVSDLPRQTFEKLNDEERLVAFDIETTGLDPITDTILGVSMSWEPGEAYWVPVDASGGVPPVVSSILSSPLIPKVTHGGKFDLKFLKARGYAVSNLRDDTHILSYVLQTPGSRKLKDLGVSVLGESVTTFEDIVGEGQDFSDVELAAQTDYACQDADLTLRLYHELYPRVVAEKLDHVYHQIEMPLVPILADMELAGAPVSIDAAQKLAKRISGERDVFLQSIFNEAGEEFNPDSPHDLRRILFEKLGLTPVKETKTGYSIDKFTLMVLQEDHVIVNLILEYRKRDKLLSTYLWPLINDHAGQEQTRIHGSFNQTVTATGRLSSSAPNLQNQPPDVRPIYKVQPGHRLIAIDYSQQELRLLAHMSQDPTMTKAFMLGEDIHEQTAKLLGIPRKLAKNVNFGIPYGAGPQAIARQGKCSVQEASRMLENHKAKYPELWNWIARRKEAAHALGYSDTITGRRRYLPGIFSNLPEVVAAAEREAVNMAIQGSAADVTKLAMLETSKVLDPSKARLIMQVHDELVFEVIDPSVDVDKLTEELSNIMVEVGDTIRCSVPLLVDAHHGDNWGALK